MKKILTLLAGIVFLIAILVAGGCGSADDPDRPQDPEIVKIYLKAKKIDGKMHLKMYDSNKRSKKVIDMLETEVPAGSTVIWKRTWFSRIEEIKKIGSTKGNGIIFKEDAQPIPDTKRFMLEVPKNVKPGEREEYDIDFLDKDNITHRIDPYLKIR